MMKSILSEAEEHKVVDIGASGTSVAAGAIITVTQAIIEGDGVDQRTARQIHLEKVNSRLLLALPAASTGSTMRVIYFLDTMCTGTVPTVLDVLTVASVTSYYNSINLQQNRFKILHDGMYPMVWGAHTAIYTIVHNFVMNKRITYGASTSVAAANRQNAMFMLIITDSALNAPTYLVNNGLRFTDV
jgi:hypothetical protein